MGYKKFPSSYNTDTNSRFIAHAGWGGQYLYTDPRQDLVMAFQSTLENDSGLVVDYAKRLLTMPFAVADYFDKKKD